MNSILAQAVDWYVRLHESTVSEATHSEWQAWLAADPQHAAAWKRIEQLQQRLTQAPAALASSTLERARQGRRATLKTFALLLGAGMLGWQGYQASPWRADYTTRVGQRRTLTLADGSRLVLDTDTRVDVRFDAQQRLIILRHGEILVETGKDSRPLSVQSAEGRILALGTRFAVRQGDGVTRVTVEAHAVEVRPRLATAPAVRADAGHTLTFAADRVGPLQPAPAQASAWTTRCTSTVMTTNWPPPAGASPTSTAAPGCACTVAPAAPGRNRPGWTFRPRGLSSSSAASTS
ncbi:transmembrane sensor [Pseudomonas donghuensis]|uniref:FecR domain-containing protein n=1 Tax=Pseudomonas donghuensis TaxID=1163398 RepID=UPI0039E1CC98